MATLWRRRRWRLLLNLIDHLPAASHYAEAQADDEDVARQMAGRTDASTYRPRISEWSPQVAELANVTDRLGEITAVLLATAGQRPPRIAPRPRPETALDRIRRQTRLDKHAALVRRMLPHRSTDKTEGS